MKILRVAVLIMFECSMAHAGLETVLVKKAMDDKAISD